VPHIELIPTPTGHGTIIFRAITVGPGERLRRALRRVLGRR